MRASEPGPRTVGRYVLCDEIASGGMATVHIGRLIGPVGFARTVAIKRLHAHFARDPEFVAMFLDEARLAARVRHANVVATLDVVVLKGELFVIMDYVHGESLAALVRACKVRYGHGVPVAIALTLVSGALYGLHAAHEATNEYGAPLSIVHRDVSPQNVLVGLDGVARVVDFGVAKAADRLQTTTQGGLKGKVAYMSPEQAAAKPVDRRTDVYAAAVVLWEMLTARRLFRADSEVGLIQAVLVGDVVPPSVYVPGLPPDIDALVMRGLSKDPDRRFSTAWEMAEAAQQIAYATPGQVASWVQGLSGKSLDVRAARVAQIESDSAQVATAPRDDAPESQTQVRDAAMAYQRVLGPGAVAGGGLTTPLAEHSTLDEKAPLATAPELPSSQVSAFNVVTPVRRARTPVVIAIAAPLLLMVGVGALLVARTADREPVAASPAASTAAPADVTHPASAAASAPVAASAPSSAAASASAAPAAEPASSASATPSSSARARDKPRESRAPPRRGRSCNPPYTIDANGIRQPKMECL